MVVCIKGVLVDGKDARWRDQQLVQTLQQRILPRLRYHQETL